MAPRCGTLTAALALARLQRLLDDVAWSAAQYDEMRGGKEEALRLDRLAERLQAAMEQVLEPSAAERLTLDLDEEETAQAQAWYEAQEALVHEQDARRAADET